MKLHTFTLKTIDGEDKPLSDYAGRALLIVNTASECGYTPQYAGLEELHKKYSSKGLSVLAFPANEFGAQEPGSDAQIAAFCSSKFMVSFDLFSKLKAKGPGIAPLYAYLTAESPFPGEIAWNFTKFLAGRDGTVLARFEPDVEPTSDKVLAALEKALQR